MSSEKSNALLTLSRVLPRWAALVAPLSADIEEEVRLRRSPPPCSGQEDAQDIFDSDVSTTRSE